MTRPLEDLLVLDLTHGLPGPFATAGLADLGARVIKVEQPGRGDEARHYPPFKDGKSAYFAALNHSKRSIALDLTDAEARATFDTLLARADVLVENFRPGTLARLGYGWDALHKAHPGLVYGTLSGYGQTGPDAKRPAFDPVIQARGGLMSVTGPSGGPPLRAGASISDVMAALYLNQGLLAALVDRKTTGQGRRVDVAMLDCLLPLMGHALAEHHVTGKPPLPLGARHPTLAPCDSFEAADMPFVIAAGTDALFDKLCLALNLPLSDDPRFATNRDRCRNARLLRRLIETVTLEQTAQHWIARLTAAGIPVAPIQSMDQVVKDPQIAARHMIVDVTDRHGRAAFRAAGCPIKLSDTDDRSGRKAAPDLDGNRGEILRWLDEG